VFETPIHQIAHIDTRKAYHTTYTTLSLRMNSSGSKHAGDKRN